MPLEPQTGVAVYQFIVDRLEGRRREQYPDDRQAYERDWTAAHDLDKAFAEAVHAGDLATAQQLLRKLNDMAAPWSDHPHHPAHDAGHGHQADLAD
ncbi:hypothetical protein [Streptomyces sp. NPDC007355]|uniref:hypothetical protein n=1 Tax=Streptomyces sp. NPDC007355 TaxID=3364778 RepID=UPI0036942929